MRTTGIAGLLLILLSGCTCRTVGAPPAPIQDGSSAGVVKHSSGFRFPVQVGDFTRVDVHKYDPDGEDLSAGYNHDGLYIAATVFVYPRNGKSLRSHFNELVPSIASEWPGAIVGVEKAVTLVQVGGSKDGLFQSFEAEQSGMNKVSDTYLFEKSEYFVKYRLTYPAHNRVQAETAIRKFMKHLTWIGS